MTVRHFENYCSDASITILDKLLSKDWFAYEKEPASESVILSLEESRAKAFRQIIKGPVKVLNVDTSYIVLPVTKMPTNPDVVMQRIQDLVEIIGDYPSIDFRGRLPWSGFTLHNDEVKIHNSGGDYASYDSFINALDTIVDSRTGKYDEPMKPWERN